MVIETQSVDETQLGMLNRISEGLTTHSDTRKLMVIGVGIFVIGIATGVSLYHLISLFHRS